MRRARPVSTASPGDRYHFAFDGSLDELAVVDPNTGILEINATFVQRSSFGRAQVVGLRIESSDATLSPDQRAELNLRLRARAAQVRAQKPRADASTHPIDPHGAARGRTDASFTSTRSAKSASSVAISTC